MSFQGVFRSFFFPCFLQAFGVLFYDPPWHAGTVRLKAFKSCLQKHGPQRQICRCCAILYVSSFTYMVIYLHTWHSVTVAGKVQDDGCWTRRDNETAIAGPSWIMQKLESKDWKDNLTMDKWRSQQEFSLSSFEFYCIMNRLGCSW